jgi:hypothetical protein
MRFLPALLLLACLAVAACTGSDQRTDDGRFGGFYGGGGSGVAP